MTTTQIWTRGCGITLAWGAVLVAAAAAPNDAQLTARINQLAGRLERDADGAIVTIDLSNRPATDDDLRLLAAAPSLQRLLLWGPDITDAGLDHLASLDKLNYLGLDNTMVSDAGLPKLAELDGLKSLVFQRSIQVTNDGMAAVAKLPNLTYLTLLYTQITDPGLAALKNASKLRLLDLRGSKVGDAGLRN